LCNLKNDGDEEYNDKTLLAWPVRFKFTIKYPGRKKSLKFW
jgi:hypothetical protein